MDRPTYFQALFGKRDKTLDAILRRSLLDEGLTPMQVDDESARVLQLLTLMHSPRSAVEVGTYFGYSAIHIARGLPPGGHLTTLEAEVGLANLARRNIEEAGLSDRIEVVIGDACDHLATLAPGSIDMIFIDGDKRRYPHYLRLAFGLLRPGGLLIADDCWADADFSHEAKAPESGVEAVRAINTYNRAVVQSPALFSALFGTGHGLLVSCKAPHGASAVTSR